MKVGICDYPSAYLFPPSGYGSIERWLWAAATGARIWGATVHLLGPRWRNDLPDGFSRNDVRLEDLRAGDAGEHELDRLGLDLLIVGHEYPALPEWRRTWQQLRCDVATFQHDPHFSHPAGTFDGVRSRLYCYSAEMAHRYAEQKPRRELSVQIGLDEEPLPAVAGRDLLWLGRICEAKAPHLAAYAARKLGRKLRIVGPIHDEDYVRRRQDILRAPHVQWAGELGGQDKALALRDASVMVYTCSRDYIEAGAAVFADAIRAGTPVAALAWRPGTCPDAALCNDTGAVASVYGEDDDTAAAEALMLAILAAERLDPETVQSVGLQRFDPVRHFEALAALR
ncbi:glycosyltransferase [Catelliglobosispora koreensis]|uniref:glycosyltransferase n=1 Tax=Catelliglobosispora koreensis TaxID=129052 RepID=UPI000477C96B|nr:glycosyltransferase [Catelliglobosispora koreensis]